MEEKILIKSERYNVKKALIIMIVIGVILSVIAFMIPVGSNMGRYDDMYEQYVNHQEEGSCGSWLDDGNKCWEFDDIEENPSKIGYAISRTVNINTEETLISIIPVGVFTLIGVIIYFWLRSYELTVTDKRIYGKVAWGKRIDLPVDSVSAIATTRIAKGVSISTSSGRISFLFIKNANKIYEILNNILIERQPKKVNVPEVSIVSQSDEADLLKKYKDLYDNGVITQEEFDAKKKQLLGF